MLLGAALALTTRNASAQAQDDSTAMAQQAFDKAKELHKQKKFAEACPLFEESQRLAPGLGTLLFLSDCYEKEGKTASAWSGFRDAAELAKRRGETERQRVAEERVEKLAPRLSRIRIVAPRIGLAAEVHVLRNGWEIGSALWGEWLPVDPGEHSFKTSANGYLTAEQVVHVPAGAAQVEFSIPTLEPEPKVAEPLRPPPIIAPPPPVSPQPEAPKPVAAKPESTPGSLLISGSIVGGAGLVSIAVGAYFGVRALDEYESALDHCAVREPSPAACSQLGFDLRDDAVDSALASTLGIALGSVVGGTGIVLLVVGATMKVPDVNVVVGPARDGTSLTVRGRF